MTGVVLAELRIKNLAVVEDLVLKPGAGLNIISGETGAGKTILVQAIELLLGGRGGGELIRAGADAVRVEGLFQFEDREFFHRRGLRFSLEDRTLLLTREIARGGRNRILVNDELATVNRLKSIGDVLADLHGQHEHQALLRPETHVGYLDRFGQTREGGSLLSPADSFRRARAEYLDVRSRLDDLVRRRSSAEERRGDLLHAISEIEAAALKPGEEEILRKEYQVLAHAEKLASALQGADGELTEGDGAVVHRLSRALKNLSQAAGLDPELKEPARQVGEALLLIQEASRALLRYRDRLDFEPDRADWIENRLQVIARLKKKYGAHEDEILARGRAMKKDLDGLIDEATALTALTAESEKGARSLIEAGRVLRAWREEVAARLVRGVGEELKSLGMPKARLQVAMEEIRQGDSVVSHGEESVGFSESGLDRVEFTLEANPGEPARPLHRVASGGELSRVMLALKAVFRAADPLPILVFDEVDAGIGGQVAVEVGQRLKEISSGRQIFVVTHLPMIACHADHHYRVAKFVERGRTLTRVVSLDQKEREEELARMLAGAEKSQEALATARALLRDSQKGDR